MSSARLIVSPVLLRIVEAFEGNSRPMRKVLTAAIVYAATAGLSAVPSSADQRRPEADKASAFLRVYGPTRPPFGFVRFCQEFPAECAKGALETARMAASPERLAELVYFNRQVNSRIRPATDKALYGVEEHWTVPTTEGDCEDYAILKRQLLIAAGWPPGSLVITVVRDEHGEGHAVLTARLSTGDFILDNKTDDILIWSRTPYTFLMRQSYVDPMVWVSLDPSDASVNLVVSGERETRRNME